MQPRGWTVVSNRRVSLLSLSVCVIVGPLSSALGRIRLRSLRREQRRRRDRDGVQGGDSRADDATAREEERRYKH
jgi:hypothetical protein